MQIIIILFTVLVAAKSSEAGKFYNVNGTTYYISHPMNKNWYQAQRYCTLHGMFLATIHTEPENDIILDLMEQFQVTQQYVHFWTSGTDLGQANREFYWTSSGLPLTFTNWLAGSPRTSIAEKLCVLLHGDAAKYKWYDYDCNTQQFFICQSRLELPRLFENKVCQG